jgi:hypothetical protein
MSWGGPRGTWQSLLFELVGDDDDGQPWTEQRTTENGKENEHELSHPG